MEFRGNETKFRGIEEKNFEKLNRISGNEDEIKFQENEHEIKFQDNEFINRTVEIELLKVYNLLYIILIYLNFGGFYLNQLKIIHQISLLGTL